MPTKNKPHDFSKPTQEDTPALPRDPFFYPFRTARSASARTLVTDVQGILDMNAATQGLRQRKRRPADQSNYERAVAAVVADLIYWYLTEPGRWVAVSLSNRHVRSSRYRSSVLGNTFSALLDSMAHPDNGWIELVKGGVRPFGPHNMATTIRATPSLINRAEELRVGLEDFGIDDTDETIVLKVAKEAGRRKNDARLEYEDTVATGRYREEMRRINAWIANAELGYDGPKPEHGVIDIYDRRLRRYFNGSWDRGGRLFGGFWMNLKKAHRADLYIDGLDPVTLDYSQMAVSSVYAMAGRQCRGQDAYAIEGFHSCREGIKKLLNAMLYADKPLTRFPKGVRAMLPAAITFSAATEAIMQAHAPIRDYLYRGVGLEAMFRESQILVDVLLRLIDQGITALPIHDAVMVSKRHVGVTKDIMERVFRDHLGVATTVREEE